MREERNEKEQSKSITLRTPGTRVPGQWSRKDPHRIKWPKDILRAVKSTVAFKVVCTFII